MVVTWKEPWYPLDDPDESEKLLAELHRELPTSHLLSGVHATAIGRRQDCDDVAFALDSDRIAVVHLTWARKRETDPSVPWTVVYESAVAFSLSVAEDHAEWA